MKLNENNEEIEKNIESKLNMKECPFVKMIKSLHFGVYMLAGNDEISYICSVDNGTAKGGEQRISIPSNTSTPCNMEYAKSCMLYIEQMGKEKLNNIKKIN